MGKDISLILADSRSMTDIISASRQKNAIDSILQILGQSDSGDNNFPRYVAEVVNQDAMTQNTNLNTGPGFIASWLLASTRPSWYFRNCSISLFLESQNIPPHEQYRYITDWAPILKSVTEELSSANHFTEANYSLGCFMSPENCENLLDDYKQKPEFKTEVDAYFGIFTAGLLDAIWSAIQTNTGLIESADLFSPVGADPTTGKLQVSEQLCYTINTYHQTNYALQIFSIEVQKANAQATVYRQQGQEERVVQCKNRINSLIAMMIKNGNNYIDEVSHKNHLEIPRLSANDWGL